MTELPWPAEIEGWFWRPSRTPQKIRGLLVTSWDDGAELRLEDPIDDGSATYERLYGEDMALRPLVLTDLFTRERRFATNEPTRFWQRLHANGALLGSHRPKSRFRTARVELDGLREFLAAPAIRADTQPLRAEWTAPPPVRASAEGLTIKLQQDPLLRGTASDMRFRSLTTAELTATPGRDLFAWHQTVESLGTLIGLCTSKPATLRQFKLVDSQGRVSDYRFAVRPFRTAGGADVWLTAPLLGSYLGAAIEHWYRYRQQAPESALLVAEYVAFSGHLNWVDRLLLLARFVEVHDRRRRKGGRVPQAQHRARLAAVLAAAPAEHRNWLRQSLSFSNNLTLRERLVASIAALGPEVLPLFGGATADAFAKGVTDTRNYYTHYSSGLARRARREWDLTLLTKRLWFVVRGLLLLEMGLPQPIVIEALRADRESEWLSHQPG